MEKMPYQELPVGNAGKGKVDWRFSLPSLAAERVTLRELQPSDAPGLLSMLAAQEVAEFVSPMPPTVEGFERLIAQAHEDRLAGRSFSFGVVPAGYEHAIGLFQVRELEPGFGSAEWGFAMGSPFWGTGVFLEAARRLVGFSFDVIGVNRLEARVLVGNGRGNGAMRKVGAVQEGVLRRSFLRNGEYSDQILWSILKDDWRRARTAWEETLH